MVLLDKVRTNALDYRTCGITTFHSHAPRKGDGVLSAKCNCFGYYCCPFSELTTHCNQCILQDKLRTLLLNGSQIFNFYLESKVSRVMINK